MIPALTNLKCISRPGVRFYANAREIPQVLGGLGMTIVSTSKGILTDKEARKERDKQYAQGVLDMKKCCCG